MTTSDPTDDAAKQWDIILLVLSSEEKKIDRTCDGEVETMQYFCQNEGIRKILLQFLHTVNSAFAKKMSDEDTALKCDEVSLLWRQRGNEMFRANQVDESYKCYAKSVLYATQDGPMFPLALANRSAALLRLKQYSDCLDDLSLALDHGYPTEQRHKLLIRRCDCYIELGLRTEAQSALSEALNHAATLDLSRDQLSEFERHIKTLEKKMAVMVDKPKEVPDPLPECYKGDNPNFVNASNAIEIHRNKTEGRYVLAREPLQRGDILFSEEPYAWITLADDMSVCEMCCQTSINSVPCSTCSRAIYCSVSCRQLATEFHRFECKGAQFGLFHTIGIAHLALRVLLIATAQGFPPPPAPLRTPKTAAEIFECYSSVDNVEIYKKDTPAFFRMFNLVTNIDKMNNGDFVMYAVTATMLSYYLESYTNFFEYLPTRLPYKLSKDEQRYFVASFILRAVCQLVSNGHAAVGLDVVDDSNGCTMSERELRRATAIYPSAAMMNHSCDPNIINTFYKSRIIIRCGRETLAGAEVLNCYGPHRSRTPTKRRRALLKSQYHFTCNCTACLEPRQMEFMMVFSAYLCQSCKGPVVLKNRKPRAACQNCRAIFDLKQAQKSLEHAEVVEAQVDTAQSLRAKCEHMQAALRIKQQILYRHNIVLREATDKLARLHAEAGDFARSLELIKYNIQSIEYQYGSNSVEVAHEMRKLADVMVERIIMAPQHCPDYRDWCLETHKIIKKTVQLMELNYGGWEPLVKRLREQETLVANHLAEAPEDPVDWVHNRLHYNLKI